MSVPIHPLNVLAETYVFDKQSRGSGYCGLIYSTLIGFHKIATPSSEVELVNTPQHTDRSARLQV